MQTLALLFTDNSLQYQIKNQNFILDEELIIKDLESKYDFIDKKLDLILQQKFYDKIEVFSALNKFNITSSDFKQHHLAENLIALNAKFSPKEGEVMLAINKKNKLQFYYSFPQVWYQKIKAKEVPTNFNFTAEHILNKLEKNNLKQHVHIHLYHDQVEFFVFDKQQVLLYNNLDAQSEVDFLYFILFTINKLGLSVSQTEFLLYGELLFNETFISELRKFCPHVREICQNTKSKTHFILN